MGFGNFVGLRGLVEQHITCDPGASVQAELNSDSLLRSVVRQRVRSFILQMIEPFGDNVGGGIERAAAHILRACQIAQRLARQHLQSALYEKT